MQNRTTLRVVPTRQAGADPAVRRVLVVDDSRVQRRILARFLTRLGFEPVEAASGREALERGLDGIDLILSDWIMPDMDGLELCRAVRERSEGYVYFILLTSKSDKAEVAEGLDEGADDFLSKPVGLQELRARIAAGDRILAMERQLVQRNHVATAALRELQIVYEALDRDLAEARRLQQSLVRERRRRFAEAEVNLLLQPSGHVGGDLVGFYRIGSHGVGLYGVDVSGHGVASALLAARLAVHLAGNAPGKNVALGYDARGRVVGRPPAQVAESLNRLMLEEVETGHYFTMLLAHADLATGRVALVQAGHPSPLVQRADGRIEQVGDGGMPIGLLQAARFESRELQLSPGDRLLVCSDGFAECQNAAGDFLGDRGLMRLVDRGRQQQGSVFLETLVWDLSAFAGDRDFADDLSAVLFEYFGPEET